MKRQQSASNIRDAYGLNATATTTKIIFIYIVLGIAWILLSDTITGWIFDDADTLRFVQSLKGIFFIIFTSIVFYLIIHYRIELYVMTILDLNHAYIKLEKVQKESKSLEDKLYHMAYYDPLTGLPNKAMLEETINNQIKMHGHGQHIGFVYFDVDEFRNINEVKGHSVGDQLLGLISDKLNQIIKSPHMLARIGGDEFVIVYFDIEEPKICISMIEEDLSHIRDSFILDDDDFFITYSAGVALYPEHGLRLHFTYETFKCCFIDRKGSWKRPDRSF